MDDGKWYIQGEGGAPISDCMDELRKRYDAVAYFFGVQSHNGTIREIDFIEAVAERIEKIEEQGEKHDIKLRLLEQRIKYLSQAVNDLDGQFKKLARDVSAFGFITVCLAGYVVIEILMR